MILRYWPCLTFFCQWDERFFTLDPLSISHVLKNTTIYEKPWTSRRIIEALIGCGLLAAEGTAHKRQRRVTTPAFSVSNMRALIPLVFGKGRQLRDKWLEIMRKESLESGAAEFRIDVAQWVSRATFDVIGLAGELLAISLLGRSADL
jgi:cytochrome P450